MRPIPINVRHLAMTQQVGSITGQAVAWNRVHNTNKKSNYGFAHRMGRHLGYNIVGAMGGTLAASAGYLGLQALRRR